MTEKEKGSDALLPKGWQQRIRDQLDAEDRRLEAEQTRVDAQPLAEGMPASPD